ncbi:hypothetical protein Q3G72_004446 [Acer saccharum]|nr:hypothetical protein Q3G72_004446 [Acer saccharum]
MLAGMRPVREIIKCKEPVIGLCEDIVGVACDQSYKGNDDNSVGPPAVPLFPKVIIATKAHQDATLEPNTLAGPVGVSLPSGPFLNVPTINNPVDKLASSLDPVTSTYQVENQFFGKRFSRVHRIGNSRAEEHSTVGGNLRKSSYYRVGDDDFLFINNKKPRMGEDVDRSSIVGVSEEGSSMEVTNFVVSSEEVDATLSAGRSSPARRS